jgi:Pyruvate/2-oxoacid:ferredoxin oxidoreductase delta subunit
MKYGIYNINKIADKENIIICNKCENYYYEEIIDERDVNSLAFIWDEENEEFFKGCPLCNTDDYLQDFIIYD